jgi:hypothetical protein
MNTDRSTDTSSDKPEDNSAYLDIDSTCIVGGDDISWQLEDKEEEFTENEAEREYQYFRQVEGCGPKRLVGSREIPYRYKNVLCEKCGGKGGCYIRIGTEPYWLVLATWTMW